MIGAMSALPTTIDPKRPPTRSRRTWAWIGVVLCAIYLLNLDAGIFELVPDNFPVIGNLDEAGATVLLLKCLGTLRSARRGAGNGPN